MAEVNCHRCHQTREALSEKPIPTALGDEVVAHVCQACWAEWIGMSTKIINEYRLQLFRPEHREMLEQQLKLFLNIG